MALLQRDALVRQHSTTDPIPDELKSIVGVVDCRIEPEDVFRQISERISHFHIN